MPRRAKCRTGELPTTLRTQTSSKFRYAKNAGTRSKKHIRQRRSRKRQQMRRGKRKRRFKEPFGTHFVISIAKGATKRRTRQKKRSCCLPSDCPWKKLDGKQKKNFHRSNNPRIRLPPHGPVEPCRDVCAPENHVLSAKHKIQKI